MSEPQSALIAPVADDPIPNVLENALDGSFTSPSFLIGEAMVFSGLVGTNDPWAFVTDRLTGDWQAVQVAGKALEGLASFNASMAEELSTATSNAAQSWKGEASDKANRYFTELGDVIGRQSSAIRSIAEQLVQTSIGMYEMSESIKDALGMIADFLLIAGVKLVAAAFGLGSGVGAVASAGLIAAALLMAQRAWKIFRKVQEWMGYAWAGAQATVGVIAGNLASVKDVPLPQLPGSAYAPGGA